MTPTLHRTAVFGIGAVAEGEEQVALEEAG
jgi:hypothetical protein